MTSLEYDAVVFLNHESRRATWHRRLADALRRRHAEHRARQALARMDAHLLEDIGYENDRVLGEIRRVVPEA